MRLKKTAYRELHDLYSSWNIVRVVRLRRESWMEYAVFRRPRLRCQDNTEMDLREREVNSVGRIHLAQGRDR
jgi:hypothetical protein